ncbi:MAG: hypothetical protein IJZ93_06940 [Clostridia bacterium]|nr:hypothetical protein [Clostridia bacterium]
MEKAINIFKKAIPYILIYIFARIGAQLVLHDGLNVGDDYWFHMANILDKYKSVLDGEGFSAISGNLAMGLGSGGGLFYSPLSHLTVVIMALILNVFGVSLMSAYKVTLVLSVFVSGVFMYRFAIHFSKGNKIASLLSAACYILYPYRLFDAFCRLAFAEAFSFLFIPLFFMGLYDITHFDKEIKIIPFVEVIAGGALLYLSHNITALYAFIAGILYLLAKLPAIIKLLKNKKYIIYGASSVVLLIGISSIALFSQMELMATDLYNISDEVRMWTNAEEVVTRVGEEWNYSGFLNLIWLNNKKVSTSFLFSGIIMFILGCALCVIADRLLSRIDKLKYFHLLISGVVLFVTVSITARRFEIYLGAIVFYLLYAFLSYTKAKETEDKIYKNTLFWFSIGMIVLLFYIMREAWVWKIVPQMMRNIQFPWRVWSLVQLFVSVLVGIVAYYYANKRTAICALAVFVGFLSVGNMAFIEKRIAGVWESEISESYFDRSSAIGFNKEYCPQVFFDDEYTPEHYRSLYYSIKTKIPYSLDKYEDYSLKPVILDGKGKINVNECFAPEYDMSIELSEDSLIQLPLFYYPGYKISALSENGEEITLDGENTDGLVSFRLEAGSYRVTTEYEGTTLRKISKVFTVLSIIVTVGALCYAVIMETPIKNKIKIKNKKKIETEN